MSGLAGRSIVSIDDLTNTEIENLFAVADSMLKEPSTFFGRAAGKVAATLFYEPSTRTRLSFEAAMQRLGGGVISTWDMNAASVTKGETLPDTIRVVSGYSDVIILRHPWEGVAQLAAEYASVPVINGGDGGHEHPTQTLCDLYTLHKRYGKLRGLKVALCGDLQNGRTIHSLAFALARFQANIVFVPGDGKEIPSYVLRRLEREFGAWIKKEKIGVLGALFGQSSVEKDSPEMNAIYITPTQPNQLALIAEEGTRVEVKISGKEQLSIYVTRLQVERDKGSAVQPKEYPRVTAQTLKVPQFKNISILHPLPRVDEVSPEIDQDSRSLYFKQSAYGLPIRMALLLSVLGLDDREATYAVSKYSRPAKGPVFTAGKYRCVNSLCVTNHLSQFARKRFEIARNQNYVLRCLYCDQESEPPFAGNAESRAYYPTYLLDRFTPRVKLANVRFFASEQEAEEAKFRAFSPPQSSSVRIEKGANWIESISRLARAR